MNDRPRLLTLLAIPAAAVLLASQALATPRDLEDVLDALINAVAEEYVDPDVAARTADHVAERFDAGAYDGLEGVALARVLTADLRQASLDLHMRVTYAPEQYEHLRSHGSGELTAPPEVALREAQAANFGFTRVEVLEGNVGYLKLDTLSWQPGAEEKACAAMALLADCEALLIDLRENGGGHSEMVQLLASYLFPAEPVRLLRTFHYRAKEDEELWTRADLPGRYRPAVPVWVLTSAGTFSAAEALAYDLAARGRAVVVGQRSSGGANPVSFFPLADGFVAKISVGTSTNAATGTSFEGTGVAVDVECAPGEALARAHLLALERRLETCAEWERQGLEWSVDWARARAHPGTVAEALLRRWAGNWGGVAVAFEGGALRLDATRQGRGWVRLLPLSERAFVPEGVSDFKVGFEEGADGAADRVWVRFRDGSVRFFERLP